MTTLFRAIAPALLLCAAPLTATAQTFTATTQLSDSHSVPWCVGCKPIRDVAALVSGPPCNLAIGETLLAQSMKHLEYFLAGLSVCQAGAAVLCRSAGDSIF